MNKIIGYNVYRCADGCAEEFYGFAKSLAAARRLAKGRSLAASMYDTARAAGHCGGLEAPDKSSEGGEVAKWFSQYNCAVAVFG